MVVLLQTSLLALAFFIVSYGILYFYYLQKRNQLTYLQILLLSIGSWGLSAFFYQFSLYLFLLQYNLDLDVEAYPGHKMMVLYYIPVILGAQILLGVIVWYSEKHVEIHYNFLNISWFIIPWIILEATFRYFPLISQANIDFITKGLVFLFIMVSHVFILLFLLYYKKSTKFVLYSGIMRFFLDITVLPAIARNVTNKDLFGIALFPAIYFCMFAIVYKIQPITELTLTKKT